MAEETKVKIRLDARQAKSELSGLVRESTRAAGKVASGIRATVGKGLGAVGFGAAVGTGISAVRGATESGVGDIVGETFHSFGANMEEWFFGDMSAESRAAKSAREETKEAFGAIAGSMNGGAGGVPPGSFEFYTNTKSLRMQEEVGRRVFDTAEQFQGTAVKDLVTRIGDMIGKELASAVEYLVSFLPFTSSK